MSEAPPEHPLFARFYERMIAGTEKAGLSEMRRSLLSRASGRTLEVGAGTGLNLPFYTDAVSELVLAEPDPHMAKRLRLRLSEQGPPADIAVRVIEAGAEDLPFDDESLDTVVSTLVLCTVESPEQSLAEARRVLVEGGALLYLEHVRSEGRARAWWQDRLDRPWGVIAGGCHPNRPTPETLADAGFWVEQMDRTEMPKAPPWMKPMISGVARRPEAARR
ncbi:MAG: class I SAM-dependent methyltransferase [Actinomycetota bacterium]|nr:class I SAM-dependent methyltransferase [Actinomycetota bacterium]